MKSTRPNSRISQILVTKEKSGQYHPCTHLAALSRRPTDRITSSRSSRFGEDSVEKMVDWALENVPTDPAPYILEVGAGNGNLLFALCDAGYAPHNICGVDYSADAINLAQAIAKARAVQPSAEDAEGDEEEAGGGPGGADKITFATCDFLQDEVARLDGMVADLETDVAVWDFVLDKGTFDAIALAEKDEAGKAPADGYPARIGRVVKPGGYFLITCEFLAMHSFLCR